VVEDVFTRHGRIDILVNNAGIGVYGKSEGVPAEEWEGAVSVMLSGVFFTSQAVGRVMISRGRGSIVNIASIGGMGGWPLRAAYNAAKAGVINLTEVLAAEPDNPRARLAAELLASEAHRGTNARARAFVAQGGGCRATFFNYRRRLAGGGS